MFGEKKYENKRLTSDLPGGNSNSFSWRKMEINDYTQPTEPSLEIQ